METDDSLQNIQREQIIRILKKVNGNKSAAAKILQINRGTLYRRLRAYQLDKTIRKPLEGL